MRNILFISLTIALLFGMASCSKGEDYKLSQSVFVADPNYPDLPEYSDWGYNTFGAYIDRIKFVSGAELPIKITVKKDTCTMMFNGRYKGKETILSFIFPKEVFPNNILPKEKFDLLVLNGKSFDFKNTGCLLTLKRRTDQGFKADTLEIIEGRIEFKNVKKLYVNKKASKTILSGKFDFQVYLDGIESSILNGRFDFGIDRQNFYFTEED